VPIVIRKVEGGFIAHVSPPHGQEWHSVEPSSRDEVVAQLRALACHTTDIGDAFFAADPDWLGEK